MLICGTFVSARPIGETRNLLSFDFILRKKGLYYFEIRLRKYVTELPLLTLMPDPVKGGLLIEEAFDLWNMMNDYHMVGI